jgi:hypothetical protein
MLNFNSQLVYTLFYRKILDENFVFFDSDDFGFAFVMDKSAGIRTAD